MEDERQRQIHADVPELVEGRPHGASDVAPVLPLLRPMAYLRSPILAHHSIEPRSPVPDPDRPSIAIPQAREFVRPLGWATLAAAPVLALFGWQAAVIAAAVAAVIREIDVQIGRTTFSFGDAFVSFPAQDAWPHGVQEEDEVRWKWSPRVRDGYGARG